MTCPALRTSALQIALALAALGALAGCAPQVDFTVDVTGGAAPLEVQFTNNSQALFLGIDIGSVFPITGYQWNFGDDTGSLEKSPKHTYDDPGQYTVSLTATSAAGTVTTTKPQLITVSSGEPAAAFTLTTNATDVREITFTDSSDAGAGTIQYRQWDFGDGNFDTVLKPVHAYDAAGVYHMSLTVCSTLGCNTRTQDITIPELTAPVANFVPHGVSSSRFTIEFIDTSTPGNIPIKQRIWTFGDGTNSTSSLETVQHTYTSGVYTATLEVCADNGLCDTAEPRVIRINSKGEAFLEGE